MNHRDAWAEERVAPSRPRGPTPTGAPLVPQASGAPTVTSATAARLAPAPEADGDILVVVSKIKKYMREKHGLSTSDQVIPVLSDLVRELCDAAAEKSRQAGRKTLMDRDF
jgi:hypothetical protein